MSYLFVFRLENVHAGPDLQQNRTLKGAVYELDVTTTVIIERKKSNYLR